MDVGSTAKQETKAEQRLEKLRIAGLFYFYINEKGFYSL
jgi:hypothetical protein